MYIQQLAQMAHGSIPYRDFAVSYPPLFLYTLFPFYMLGGASLAWVPIVLSDAATVVVIYLILQGRVGELIALGAALAYALSPFALYYEGYVWFSSQPMTFFLVLSTYYLMRNQSVTAFASLAVAVMFKQEALFMLPVMIGGFAIRDRHRMLVGFFVFVAIGAGVSLPFITTSGHSYLSLVSYGLLGRYSGYVLSTPPVSTATCTNLFSNALGTQRLCSLDGVSNYQFVTNAPPSALLFDRIAYAANFVSATLAVPMLILVFPVLLSLRARPQFVTLLLSVSAAAFMVVFAMLFHPVFKYYYVPVYALLLTCANDKKTLAVAAVVPVLSLLTFSGPFQEILPLISVLVLGALLDRDFSRHKFGVDL